MPKLISQPVIEHFIRSRLYWFGRIGRIDIVRAFGVGTAYASRLVTRMHDELGTVRVGKGEAYPPNKQEIPEGVTSQRFLSDLYNSAVSAADPTPLCGGEIAFSVIDAFRYNVPETILRPIVMALDSRGLLEIEYLGMNIGDEPKRRLIEPMRLVHVQGRWHINAYCHEAGGSRDFVLARILSVTEAARKKAADPMLDLAMNAPVAHRYVPHPALSEHQRTVVEREFGMRDGALEVRLSDGERFYFEQQFVACSEAEMPPVKLLVAQAGRDAKSQNDANDAPFTLKSLQDHLLTAYGMSPQETRLISTDLYANRMLISYPITDYPYLPQSLLSQAEKTVQAIAAFDDRLAEMARYLDLTTPSAAWDDAKVGAHHAIVPTGNANFEGLTGQEKRVFHAICERYLRQFKAHGNTQQAAA